MKANKKQLRISLNKYDYLVMSLVIIATIIIISLWIWYGHESEQLQRKIYLLK